MSLQIWLPLNGDSKNQGLSGHTMVGSPASWDNGKIGKCATFNGSTSNVIYDRTTDFNYTDNFSFCVWMNHNYSSSAGVQYAFTVGRADAGGYGYGIGVTGDSSIICRFGNKQIGVDCAANEWHHIAVTVYDTTIKIYKDGILYNTSTIGTLPTYSDGNGLGIGCFHFSSNIYPYYGSLNDFRIYNHCLSAKEIKEISKGLVCHYRLSGIGEGNLLKNTYAGCTGGNGTVTENGFNGFSYRYLKYEGTSYSDTVAVGNFVTPTADTKYTVSFWAKGTCTIRCFFYPSTCSSGVSSVGTTTTVSDGRINIPLTNEWKKYWITWTTSSTVNGSKHTVLGRIENQGTGAECYIAGVKFEKGSKATPWCPNPEDAIYSSLGYNSTTEADCSGYGNNGTKSGTITWSGDTRRYVGSYDFPTDAFINCGKGGKVTDEITVNIWCYMDTWDAEPRPISCTEGGGWNIESNGGYIQFPVCASGIGYQGAKSSKLWSSLSSGWHMFTGTYDGFNTKLYIDSVLEASVSTGQSSKTPISYNSGNSIFIHGEATGSSETPSTGYKSCKMSDCRIYATALSEEDVKSLYNVSASIDKSGVLMVYEFEEE